MNLHKLLGQLFILGFHGSDIDETSPISRDIRLHNLGGVILFDRFISTPGQNSNIESPEQLKNLCNKLQSLHQDKLLIGIDQEGGLVCRLKESYGFPPFPSPAEIAKETDYGPSERYARLTGKTLSSCGINCNFAPVADLNLNPDNPIIGKLGRSFSSEVETVTRHCEIWLDVMREEGVLGCLKHFPGHGSSTRDSHLDFVDITSSWEKVELSPYWKLIANKKAKAIMLGHLFNSNLDPEYPASLSAKTVSELLRKQMQYQGLVVTDDLQMKAVTSQYGLVEAVVLALKAGVDMIIIGNNLDCDPEILPKIFKQVEEALNQGVIHQKTLEEAYSRVQQFKAALS